MRKHWLISVGLCCFAQAFAAAPPSSYVDARWHPLHFQPAINTATDEQCLACHQEILNRKPLAHSPAGLNTGQARAWYQTSSVYQGEQDTFHRRHLSSVIAQTQMNFKCNSCHQGNNPNTEVEAQTGEVHADPSLRKKVDTDICLMCHGKFDYKVMAGLSDDWPEVRDIFQNDCVTCHQEFRTRRHEVNFLNAAAIEQAGKEDRESCYGCHGGRAWYAIPYPYVRRPWLERMPGSLPPWAENRAKAYPERFQPQAAEAAQVTILPAWAKDKLKSNHALFLSEDASSRLSESALPSNVSKDESDD